MLRKTQEEEEEEQRRKRKKVTYGGATFWVDAPDEDESVAAKPRVTPRDPGRVLRDPWTGESVFSTDTLAITLQQKEEQRQQALDAATPLNIESTLDRNAAKLDQENTRTGYQWTPEEVAGWAIEDTAKDVLTPPAVSTQGYVYNESAIEDLNILEGYIGEDPRSEEERLLSNLQEYEKVRNRVREERLANLAKAKTLYSQESARRMSGGILGGAGPQPGTGRRQGELKEEVDKFSAPSAKEQELGTRVEESSQKVKDYYDQYRRAGRMTRRRGRSMWPTSGNRARMWWGSLKRSG